jgi:hypothetical protein
MWARWLLVAAFSASGTGDELGAPVDRPIPSSTPTWDACADRPAPKAEDLHRYFLGRYGHGRAVIEVGSSSHARLARLWSLATPGGTDLSWPGGRPGVRHLSDPRRFAEATPVAQANRLYLWSAGNGWAGGVAATVNGVELAKSLCDANRLVVYVTLKFDQPGEGFLVGSMGAPAPDADSSAGLPEDAPQRVVAQIYREATSQLIGGLRAGRLAPATLSIRLFPGHFTGTAPQYAVSITWANTYDDRFSLVYLANQAGELELLLDRQEGGAGGGVLQTGQLGGNGTEALFFQLTTLDGTSAALWAVRDGRAVTLVQTTPVGD